MPDEPKNKVAAHLGRAIAANNFTPGDIEHLVTTAQEPPTQQDLEVQAELDRLAKAKASKA